MALLRKRGHAVGTLPTPFGIDRNDPQMRVLLVSPGALTSTYDVYKYTLDSLREMYGYSNFQGFLVNNRIAYHTIARSQMFMDEDVSAQKAEVFRSTTLDLVGYVYANRPDVVLFIDGLNFPPRLYQEISILKHETGRKMIVAGYLTEEPYADQESEKITQYLDVVFVNDKLAVDRLDPEGNRHVYYMPHSWKGDVHYFDPSQKKDINVFFCGTMYPERFEVFSKVDWSGIDPIIYAKSVMGDHEGSEFGNRIIREYVDNNKVADYYRRTKIAINMHRRIRHSRERANETIDSTDAYSMNPRLVEAAACGAFQITDYRPEVVDVFGDSVAIYKDAEDLEQKIKYYLSHEEEREDMARESSEKVFNLSFYNKSMEIYDIFLDALKQA